MKKKSSSYTNIFKTAFAAGAGTFLSIVPQMLIGILLFLGGLRLKNDADTEGTQGMRYYTGLVLMILGCAFGLGFGAGALIGEAME